MDPVRNPYAPGAGTPPPELAGRSDVIAAGSIALRRTAAGRTAQSMILVGLRGVGKTVLLNKLSDEAETIGYRVAFVEAHEGKSLPELLAPSLRSILYALSMVENAKEKARRGLRGLKGFLAGLRVTINDLDFGLSMDAESGLADSGNIEADLPDLIAAIGEAARAAGRPVALLMDEMQYLDAREFSALIMSMHRTSQRQLPFFLVGAGLPQTLALAGNSKSYAERLFRFPEIGALGTEEATQAIQRPATGEGVTFTADAIQKILDVTERYPYFLQQWAYESWNVATGDVVTLADVDRAGTLAINELDQSFFKVRFDRCTPAERRYMRALAEFGRGKHRSGDIAEKLGVKVTSVAPTRNSLIKKGMIYSPSHGDTAFTVPLFDEYMRRAMPDTNAASGTA
jgi:GTPase SAR1 family protein